MTCQGLRVPAGAVGAPSLSMRLASSTTTTTNTNTNTTGSSGNGGEGLPFERTVYVHPLSQVTLEHFQDAHHEWICAQALDKRLSLHRDGSFELKFPSAGEKEEETEDDDSPSAGRIWTSYDEAEKKHWLTVQVGDGLYERFLLQDNMVSAWNNNRKSLPERIQSSVDELVEAVNEYQRPQRPTHRGT